MERSQADTDAMCGCAAHRIGQTKEVFVEKLVMVDTIEATILTFNQDKSLAVEAGTRLSPPPPIRVISHLIS
jgi:hypothetical protein